MNHYSDKKTFSQPKKIAILCTLCWGGGAELLRLLITALHKKSMNQPLSIYLLFPKPPFSLKSKIKQFIKKILLYDRFFPQKQNSSSMTQKEMLFLFRNIAKKNLTVIMYKNTDKNLNHCLLKHKIDAILPLMPCPQTTFPIPWIGYVFDFQHKYLSHFFSKEEIIDRDNAFLTLAKKAPAVIVNSKAVKNDFIKYFPSQNHSHIFTLPFSPIPHETWIQSMPKSLVAKYKLPASYFLISNQFWIHKSHLTAFKALKILHNSYNQTNIHLVCTGSTHDYRKPNFFNSLKQQIENLNLTHKIHILGHIPKEEQICLLKNSIALIQPTLFEGGPGGGSVYDAVAQGIPAIISDIPVNREISEPNVSFFKTQSAEDLAQKMFSLIKSPPSKISHNTLIKNRAKNCDKLGTALLQAIDYAIKHYIPEEKNIS